MARQPLICRGFLVKEGPFRPAGQGRGVSAVVLGDVHLRTFSADGAHRQRRFSCLTAGGDASRFPVRTAA